MKNKRLLELAGVIPKTYHLYEEEDPKATDSKEEKKEEKKEETKETDAVNAGALVEAVINQALAMTVQAHFWHWQTESYATHQALGDFYDSLKQQTDALAEQYMGNEGRFESSFSYDFVPFSIEKVKERVAVLKTIIEKAETPLMKDDKSKYHGVADTLIDMIKSCDKLQYLLTLK